MAIPYNPSSFNSNKTILQAIEELKKYLQENPCYKIYMYNDNYVDGTYVYDKSGVDDPDSIEAYDVIFFANSYYSKVESVGDSTITVLPAINFTGAEGPEGPAGADGTDGTNGADGVSITNVVIDASNHLICTLSDGNTIDAGEIAGSSDHTITLTSSSGVLPNEQYNELLYDNSIIKYEINSVPYFFRKESEDTTQITFRCIRPHSTDTRIPDFIITKAGQGYQYYDSSITISGTSVKSGTATAGKVLTADGDGFTNWQSVEGTAVLSTGETSGKVLTADGSGGASWQTAGGGTTLTQYSKSYGSADQYTFEADFKNIYRNCKGNFVGRISVRMNFGSNITMSIPLADIVYLSSNYYTISFTTYDTISSEPHIISLKNATNSLMTFSGIAVKLSDNTVVSGSNPTFVSAEIIYFNDTQLHT